jgi:uncharacterized protein (DUF608 family)
VSQKSWFLAVLIAAVYALHQDTWLWRDARPLVFECLPAGLFYHAVYTIAVIGLLALCIRWAWPGHLE